MQCLKKTSIVNCIDRNVTQSTVLNTALNACVLIVVMDAIMLRGTVSQSVCQRFAEHDTNAHRFDDYYSIS